MEKIKPVASAGNLQAVAFRESNLSRFAGACLKSFAIAFVTHSAYVFCLQACFRFVSVLSLKRIQLAKKFEQSRSVSSVRGEDQHGKS